MVYQGGVNKKNYTHFFLFKSTVYKPVKTDKKWFDVRISKSDFFRKPKTAQNGILHYKFARVDIVWKAQKRSPALIFIVFL